MAMIVLFSASLQHLSFYVLLGVIAPGRRLPAIMNGTLWPVPFSSKVPCVRLSFPLLAKRPRPEKGYRAYVYPIVGLAFLRDTLTVERNDRHYSLEL